MSEYALRQQYVITKDSCQFKQAVVLANKRLIESGKGIRNGHRNDYLHMRKLATNGQ